MVATNAQARKARALFEETEGIDIYSAAGIATASLVKSVADGRIDPEKIVMLNITGGGEHRCQQDKELWYLEPSLVFPISRYCTGRIENVMILNKKRIVRISWINTRTSPAATRLPRCLRLSALGESLSLSLKRYFKSPFVRLIIFDIIISIPQAI